MSSQAWLDESEPTGSADGGYVLGAVICPVGAVAEVRDVLRALLLRGQRKLHWRDEGPSRRSKIIQAVTSIEALQLLLVVRTIERERSERRRRHCLDVMLTDLEALGVQEVYAECRTPGLDRRDRHMISALRTQRRLGPDLRLSHVPGPLDPMLWAADALCGAYGAHHVGQTDMYWLGLANRVILEAI